MGKQSCRMSQNINITEESSSQPGTLFLKNENNKKLLKSLYDQKTVGQFCDVHFVVESEVVKVHACVLASFSSYMAQILEKWKNSDDLLELHWCRKSPLKIHLNMIIEDLLNICYDCFTKIIDFMYLGHILIDSVHINHLEMLTKKLKVNELILFCSRYRYKINLDANNSVVKVGSQIDKAKMKRKIAVVNDLLLKKKPKICVGSRSRTKRVYEQNSLCPNNSNTMNKFNRKRKNIAVTNNENNESSIKVSGFNNETIKNCFVLPNNVCEVNNILESTQLVTILPEANKKTDGFKRNKNIEGTIQKSGQLLLKPHAFTSCLNNDRRGDHTYCLINETELSHSLSTNEDTFSREQTDVSKLGELMSKGNRKTEPFQEDVTSYSVVEVSQISDKQLEQNPPSTSSKDKINHTYSNVSLNVNIPKSNEKCAFKETIQFSNVVNTQEISKITNNKDKHTVTCSKSKQTDCSINDVVPKANEIIETSQGNEDNRISKPNYTTRDEGATKDNCETSVNRKICMLLEKKDTKDEMITKQIKSVLSEEETKVDKSKKHMERCIFDGKSKSDKETKTESNSFNTEKKMDRYRYSCTFCPFQSGKVQNLVTHMMHNNHEYTECLVCNYKPEDKSILMKHLQNHLGPKPFFCYLCKKNFITRTIYKEHNRSHLAASFACNLCSRTFKNQGNLKTHILLIHKKVILDRTKPSVSYKCPNAGCGFETVRKFDLNVHKKTHDKEKAFQCDICERYFSQRKHLVRHKNFQHSTNACMKCDLCEYTAMRNDKLLEHYKKKHNIEKLNKKNISRDDRQDQISTQIVEHDTEITPNNPAIHPNFQKQGESNYFGQNVIDSQIYVSSACPAFTNNSLLTTNVTCNNASKEMSTEIQSNIHGHSIGCTIRPNEGFYSSRDEMNHENSSDLSDQQKEKCKITTKQSESKYSKNDDSLTDKNHALLLPENNTQMKQKILINSYVIDDTVLNSYKRVETTCTSDTISDQMYILNEATGELLTIGVNTFSDFHDQYSNKENPDLTNKISTQNNIILHNPVLNPKSNGQESTSGKKNFITRAIFKEHNRSHLASSFACNLCSRTYKKQGNLKTHILLIHKKVILDRIKPSVSYKCPNAGCGFETVRKFDLNVHKKTHDKEKAFQCDVCERYFSQRRHLVRHKNFQHSTNACMKCDLCEYTAMQNDKLLEHYKKKHNIEKLNKKNTISRDDRQDQISTQIVEHDTEITPNNPAIHPNFQKQAESNYFGQNIIDSQIYVSSACPVFTNNSLLTTNVTCNNASKEMSTEIQSNIHGHSIGCTIRPNEGFYSSRDEMNHENSSDLSDQQKEKCKITTKQSESKYSKNDDSLTDKNHALLLPENNTQIKQNSLINSYVIDDTVLNSYKRVETTCTSDTISDQMDILNEATGELLTIGVNTFSDFHDQYSNKENPDLTNKISTQNNIILHNPVLNPKSNGQESTSECEKGDMVNLELENSTRNICDENDDLNNETRTENNIEESIYHCCANSSKRTCLLNKMVEDETFDSCKSSNKFRDRPKSNTDSRKSDPVINWYEFNSDIFSLASQSNKVNYVYLISKELSPDEYILNEHTGNIIFPTPFLNEGTGELSVINMTIDPAQFINMGNFEINETNTIDTQSIASDDNTTDDINIEQSLATNTIVNTPFEPPESENNSNSGGNFLNELTGELRKQYFNKNICTESTSNESIDVLNINKYSVLDETTGELLENKNEEFDKCLNNKSDPVINWYNFNSNILSLASQSNKVNYVYLNTKELSPDEYILNEQTGNIIFPAPFLNEGTGELSVINMTIDPMQFINMGNFEINETNNTDTQSITSDDNTTDDVNIEQSLTSNTILNAPIEPPESEENCNNGGNFLNELTGELCEKYLNKNICTESTSNGSIDVSNINKYSVLDEATGELFENKNTEFNESLIKETDMIVLNEMTGEISTNTTQSDSNNLSVSNSWNDWFFDSFQDDSIDSFPLEKRMFSDDIHLDELLFNENDRRDSWKAHDNESADILLNESTGELVKKD